MKTMAIFYSGCIEFEIMLACEMVNSKYPVEIVTPDGKDHVGSNGMTFKAACSYAQIDPADYKIVLIPGGDPSVLIGNKALSEILQKLYSSGSILGAICAGPIVLEQAGLLNGKRIAHGYKGKQLQWLLDRNFFKQTELTEESLVIEDKIVTARPDSFIDFAVEIARLSNCIPTDKASFFKNYYRAII